MNGMQVELREAWQNFCRRLSDTLVPFESFHEYFPSSEKRVDTDQRIELLLRRRHAALSRFLR